ncbi:uncharacterized protein MONOS_9761 [Monocercomonoides exilis]|uniref:uncharacterized protein n=1 Tax=Monocercomonoides exilis TaxID=2049356 RepID=UPI0035594B66|nr:hypothetical protein MONOS_9761 [Monocercomonoides exilis]|eukprot:MONOS_9761.1-p1 / transcript=MONOS_9761.1 / gene=MONOS_9761 / organism=Monocercomonoides_exilis_PA203 / gene_product=unspecified product / transcript_product=unspecified product / location=Mono_scaffold00415:50581-51066(+) / protein_length=162 / sequence_SO=supercontig / SO=protein_coding / is_pseudo=false
MATGFKNTVDTPQSGRWTFNIGLVPLTMPSTPIPEKVFRSGLPSGMRICSYPPGYPLVNAPTASTVPSFPQASPDPFPQRTPPVASNSPIPSPAMHQPSTSPSPASYRGPPPIASSPSSAPKQPIGHPKMPPPLPKAGPPPIPKNRPPPIPKRLPPPNFPR